MTEFSLVFGSSEADMLELAIFLFSLANVLQWCVFIMIFIFKIMKLHNKKENAPTTNRKHSQKHNKKRG